MYRSFSKGTNALNPFSWTPKIKFHHSLNKTFVYKWPCPDENCILSYIGKSSQCLENRINEHSSHVSSAIYQHSVSNNHPNANIFHFKIMDRNSKQVATEAREAIHIKINNPLSTTTWEKYTSQRSVTTFLEQMDLPLSLTHWET